MCDPGDMLSLGNLLIGSVVYLMGIITGLYLRYKEHEKREKN